jgi:DNA gyrase subunit B
VDKHIDRLCKLYPPAALTQMIYQSVLSVDDLTNSDLVESWLKTLVEALEKQASVSERYESELIYDKEHSVYLPKIVHINHGVDTNFVFRRDFFSSREYASIAALATELHDLLEPGSFVKRGEKTFPVTFFKDGINWLLEQSKRGNAIQRYKGLGEMNPDQLWETTMDPDARRMLQVTIEDAISADQLFTTLMGDEVEPRRAFIESNALHATNVDV